VIGVHVQKWLDSRGMNAAAAARSSGLKPWRVRAMKRGKLCRLDALVHLMAGLRLSPQELADFLKDFRKAGKRSQRDDGQLYLFK